MSFSQSIVASVLPQEDSYSSAHSMIFWDFCEFLPIVSIDFFLFDLCGWSKRRDLLLLLLCFTCSLVYLVFGVSELFRSFTFVRCLRCCISFDMVN